MKRLANHRLPRGYFADAPLSTPAGSDAAQETRPLVEAGGVQLSGATHGAGIEADTGVTAGVGLSSAPAYLDDVDRDRLRWLRRIFKAA